MKDFMTEADAANRWCPFGRSVSILDNGSAVVANRVKSDVPHCISAKCMAWRWSHQDTGPSDPPTGFCGAAVMPKYI